MPAPAGPVTSGEPRAVARSACRANPCGTEDRCRTLDSRATGDGMRTRPDGWKRPVQQDSARADRACAAGGLGVPRSWSDSDSSCRAVARC